MSENKTVPTSASVTQFLNSVKNEQRRSDGNTLLDIFQEITGEEAVMWGPSIVGFGICHYKYDSGREGDMPLVGFSPRAQNLALYVYESAAAERNKPLLSRLGKHTIGKSCLYIMKLSDVNMDVLKEIIENNYVYYKKKYNS
ncbi:MAG: DUF1801 domain-containing protein [Flavobacteriaceae bacterium]|nr:DUF1801 domain-containing protein [Flavobacteriaceae bacterium]MDH3796811.1 DUF1801 domain-containing protein [Flavobacteriaceae bacterium]